MAVTRTGAAALQRAQSENFDLALVDVDLRDIHGFALCARLRETPATQNLPVVICSAWQGVGDLALRAGAIGYLEKPQDLDRLRGSRRFQTSTWSSALSNCGQALRLSDCDPPKNQQRW